jgi:hypothetical protein
MYGRDISRFKEKTVFLSKYTHFKKNFVNWTSRGREGSAENGHFWTGGGEGSENVDFTWTSFMDDP